ncbi:hypothetical protein [Paenibacillus typhae]|uniref:hypothetical protein n=1 Tax=Paenibacillus typhae TaxID=1174501 RepID=UPI001C8D8294|nr:hypothetical protein [Paenibacillus typhae]MBY0011627.1 hypothetical protein [Paenibacillus typhae]
MNYSLEEIKLDLERLDVRNFYMKYIVKSYNWYFSEILEIPEKDLLNTIDEFKDIVSSNIGVSFNNVMMVGSSKVGYSLSPKKNFKAFELNTDSKSKSDIDVAIISQDLFKSFWDLYRKSYNIKFQRAYTYISREIYRGYINERNLKEIDACRKEWQNLSNRSNKLLRSKLYLKHDITYRIYRSWEDFEEYNLDSLKRVKDKVILDVI